MTKTSFHIALATALLATPALGCDDGADEGTAQPTGAPTAGEAQRVEVTVGAGGYQPSEVTARAGEPLTLVFTRTTDEGCGHELVIAEADIERELPLNQPVEVTFTPSEAGELRFSCGMDMYDGKIVVR